MSLPLDWLSRLLDLIPVRGHLDLRCMYGAPWRIAQEASPQGEIPYHVILGGTAVLEGPRRHRLGPGDILVLPHGEAHVLHDGGGSPPMASEKQTRLNLTVSRNGGPGEKLDMLCGRFVVAPQHARWLHAYLPAHLLVSTRTSGDAKSGTAAQLAGLVSLMRRESAADNLGGYAMLNALSTAMFTLTLRSATETGVVSRGLLAAAGSPRLTPALTALLERPGHSWTLPELAELCHMSRATLVRQFQETLGRSAVDLLTDIRMTLAARHLARTSMSTAEVAEQVGYQSEAAFQRAFRQHMGWTPAQWRKRFQSAVPAENRVQNGALPIEAPPSMNSV